jgi:hypothetical protein
MIVYELKEYPLLPISLSTELEDYSGRGYSYFPSRFIDADRFVAGSRTYDHTGCGVFGGFIIKHMYSTTTWNITNELKHSICKFAPGKYTRLRIVEKP